MKVAVSATGPTLDAAVDPRFGRCSTFVLVDTGDMSYEAIGNESNSLASGAGIHSAQMLAQKGVALVLTGNCGPNAHQTLKAAGIQVVLGCTGSVSDAVRACKLAQANAVPADNVAHGPRLEGRR